MGHPEIFISEVLNSTDVALASGIDISKILVPPDWLLDTEPEASFILIDPSSGKKKGDDCTIGHFSVIDGIPIYDQLEFGTFTPLETIKHAINMGIANNTRLICVEDVAYQSTLLFWFDHVCNSEGISGFEFVPLSPKGRAKNNRIKSGLIRLLKGTTYLHPRVRSLVISQIVEWVPSKANNTDDIIDLLGYVEEVLQEYGHIMVKQIFSEDDYIIEASHSTTSVLTSF